jgi:hypothetical protein
MMSEEPMANGESDAGGSAPAPEASPRSSSPLPRNPFAAIRARPRRATLLVALSALAVIGLIAVGLAHRPNPVSVVMVVPSSVVLGSEGIPIFIDGQRVYRLGENALWQDLNGSFLLAAYVPWVLRPCSPFGPPPLSSAESDLVGSCGVVTDSFYLAPKSVSVSSWINGPEVVMRVHTHDAEAAECSADWRSRCESAVVAEAIVWPTVPTEIAGEHVYRAEDSDSFAGLKGSFLLGGPFTDSQYLTACSTWVAGQPDAEAALIGSFCISRAIDGMNLAAKSAIDEPNDEIVVARVHVHDPLAAKCPSDYRAECDSAIVVESVVWRAPAG